jgi:hypothetical protein
MDTVSNLERQEKIEAQKFSQRRMLCDSLLLASTVMDKKKNIWDLVTKNIIDEKDDLVKCVGILLASNKVSSKIESVPINEDDIFVTSLAFAFKPKYSLLDIEDYEVVVAEYREIREWLEDEDSKV